MESALMTVPFFACATASASADFPLAVGPPMTRTVFWPSLSPFIF
jgi:hypothetical protein